MMLINKKVSFNYEIIEKYEAGIVLTGSEVKSIKNGRCSFANSFVSINKNQLILKNFEVQQYQNHKHIKHDIKRPKILLLNKDEIYKISQYLSAHRNATIVPTKIYTKKGLIKVEIAIVKGKKKYDKRQQIKEKEQKRKIDRLIRNKMSK